VEPLSTTAVEEGKSEAAAEAGPEIAEAGAAIVSRETPRSGVKAVATEEVVDVEIVDAELGSGASVQPVDKKDAKERSWTDRVVLSGLVHADGESDRFISVRFVAGLNEGRKAVVSDGGYSFGELYPGVGLLQYTTRYRKILREVRLTRRRMEKLDVYFDRSAWSRASLTDALTSLPVVNPSVDIDGDRQYATAGGEFMLFDLADGKSLVYTSAKGYEFRRTVVEWSTHRRGEIEPVKIEQRRSTPIVIEYDGLSSTEPPPVAVVVPKRSPTSIAFEKCCVVKGRKGTTTILVQGIASDEDVDLYLLADTAIATPSPATLAGLDPAATIPRQVRFSFGSRKPVRGQVLHKGVPVPDAVVKVEADDLAASTEAYFGPDAFMRFPFPVLPCARKTVHTDERGEFNLDAADVRLPATLTIDKVGLVSVSHALSAGAFNLGAVELKSSPTKDGAPAPAAAIVLDYGDARPRVLRVSYARVGAGEARVSEMRSGGAQSDPIEVAAGVYNLRILRGGAAQTLTIAAEGETRVKVSPPKAAR
jgi:hypothetical protein